MLMYSGLPRGFAVVFAEDVPDVSATNHPSGEPNSTTISVYPPKLTEMYPSSSAMGRPLPGIRPIRQHKRRHVDPFVRLTRSAVSVVSVLLLAISKVISRYFKLQVPFAVVHFNTFVAGSYHPHPLNPFILICDKNKDRSSTEKRHLSPRSISTFILLDDHCVSDGCCSSCVYNFEYLKPIDKLYKVYLTLAF